MRSPKNMRIIEIDITNACIHQCSNCTRFCGHHKQTYFMDLDTFKKAVDSLDDFEGTIGLIGGEPTLHPQFEEIAKYIASKYPNNRDKDNQLLHPQKDFLKTIKDVEASHSSSYHDGNRGSVRLNGPGLLSAMGNKYSEHYEVIQDTFKFQLLNDHVNDMYHDPILVSRKELNVPDDEWEVLRDNCWIQNEWSASITPKGAFFCEVAGTLDMLFDGPGGWEITSDWWKRDVTDFKDQLHWCEICGVACETYTRNAKDELDDISPLLYEKLKAVGSKKIKNGKFNLMDIDKNGVIQEHSKTSIQRFGSSMPYADSYASKFSVKDSKLFPKNIDAVVYVDAESLNSQFDNLYKLYKQFRTTYFIVDNLEENKESINIENISQFNFKILNHKEVVADLFNEKNKKISGTYVAVFYKNVQPKPDMAENILNMIFNPGTLIYLPNEIDLNNEAIGKWLEIDLNIDKTDKTNETDFVLFSTWASSLRNKEIELEKLSTFFDIKNIWEDRKTIPIDENIFPKVSADRIEKGKRYALYGTGAKGIWDFACIKEKEGVVSLVVDSNKDKQGTLFEGITIVSPEELIDRSKFDILVVSSHLYYKEIEETVCKMGFNKDELMYI